MQFRRLARLALIEIGIHQVGDGMADSGARGSGKDCAMLVLGRLLGGINGNVDHTRDGDDATRAFGGRQECNARAQQGEIWTWERAEQGAENMLRLGEASASLNGPNAT